MESMDNSRILKAKGGGGGSKPKSGGAALSNDADLKEIWKPDPNYKYKYSTTKNEVTYKNDYWDAASKRTILPLYVYYMKENMVFEEGYTSEQYKKTYYDGYGYNYYYGGYGYYEYAVNARNPKDNILYALLFGVVFMMCFVGTALSVNRLHIRNFEKE